jgi:hypothetical protein
MEGWIKLHRACLDHWLFTEHRPLTRQEAWVRILMTVNYDHSKSLIKGQIYNCAPGQSLLSLEGWARKFVWSIQQVRTFFKLLELDGMIKIEGLQYTTRLTVCQWETYQGVVTDQQQTANKPLTDGQQAANKPLTTTKEYKEYKEVNNIISKPTLLEIEEYCKERNNNVDASLFFDYYESKGWKVGKAPMKDWHAAVRTWERNNTTNNRKGTEIPKKPNYGAGF